MSCLAEPVVVVDGNEQRGAGRGGNSKHTFDGEVLEFVVLFQCSGGLLLCRLLGFRVACRGGLVGGFVCRGSHVLGWIRSLLLLCSMRDGKTVVWNAVATRLPSDVM